LTLTFTETAPRRIAGWISVAAFGALALLPVVSWLRRRTLSGVSPTR
jgi:hypothetical protein